MKNTFGGGNPNSLYVPMSEIEQEVISRLVEAQDLRVHVVGWGVVNAPRVTFGDLRVAVAFRLDFNAPEPPGIPLYYLDLELRTGSGVLLFKSRESTVYGDKPITVAAGMFLDMVWDIAIKAMDPNLVKAILPDTHGLTSRRQDKDTKEITLTGNMKLNSQQIKKIKILQHGEDLIRHWDRTKLSKYTPR